MAGLGNFKLKRPAAGDSDSVSDRDFRVPGRVTGTQAGKFIEDGLGPGSGLMIKGHGDS